MARPVLARSPVGGPSNATSRSEDNVARRKRSYAVEERRAPATAVSTAPPATPMISTSNSDARHRRRSTPCAWYQAPLTTSLDPDADRRAMGEASRPAGVLAPSSH